MTETASTGSHRGIQGNNKNKPQARSSRSDANCAAASTPQADAVTAQEYGKQSPLPLLLLLVPQASGPVLTAAPNAG
jgi:hypothetical protein